MTPRWKKATYTTIASLGLFSGAAGIAAAATGGSTPPAATTAATDEADSGIEVDGVDCVDGLDATTGVECDGGPAANRADDPSEVDGEEADGEEADDQANYTSSITVTDTGAEHDDAAEADSLQQLATITADQASRAALAAVPGTVNSVELDNENGSVVYSVEVTTDAGVVEVKVDAGNGNILAQETDDDGHDGHEADDGNGAGQDD